MTTQKQKIATHPKLHDRQGDLTKQWYVSYTYRNSVTKKMETFKVYEKINTYTTVAERIAEGKRVIKNLWRKLQGGWSPFANQDKKAVYADVTVTDVTKRGKKPNAQKPLDYTIKQYLSVYLIEKKPTLRKSSYQTYKSKINIFCQWLDKQDLALLPINELTVDHAALFIATLKHKSTTTQKAYINDLKTVFNHFKNEKKLISINIFEHIIKPKVKKTPQKPFNPAQRHELKKYFGENHPQIFLLVQLIFYTLIRPNEARLLLISDIDTEEGTITMRAEISKNKKTQIVALPNELKKTLLEWKIYDYPANYYLLGKGGTPANKHWGRETLIKKHNGELRNLGYPLCYSLYSWKHTGAKSLAKIAKNIKAVQLQCRHASLDQTDQYLRDLGINDFTEELQNNYPPI